MNDYIMFVDVETTGIPVSKDYDRYHHPSKLKYYEKSRIVEIAYIICDQNKDIVKQVSLIIKPTNFTIENSHIHGITQEDANDIGENINQVIEEMNIDIENVNTIVSHNLLFDLNVILSECYRIDHKDIIQKLKKTNHICTMYQGKDVMNSIKSPKLTELYNHLFQNEFDQKHRALSDAQACKDCYYKMNS